MDTVKLLEEGLRGAEGTGTIKAYCTRGYKSFISAKNYHLYIKTHVETVVKLKKKL